MISLEFLEQRKEQLTLERQLLLEKLAQYSVAISEYEMLIKKCEEDDAI